MTAWFYDSDHDYYDSLKRKQKKDDDLWQEFDDEALYPTAPFEVGDEDCDYWKRVMKLC